LVDAKEDFVDLGAGVCAYNVDLDAIEAFLMSKTTSG